MIDEVVVNENDYYKWTKINDYWYQFYLKQPEQNAWIIKTAIKLSDENKQVFHKLLDRYKLNNVVTNYKFKEDKYIILLNGNYDIEEIKKALLSLSNALNKISGKPACFRCGKVTRQGFIMDSDTPIVVCQDCQENIIENVKTNLQITSIPETKQDIINDQQQDRVVNRSKEEEGKIIIEVAGEKNSALKPYDEIKNEVKNREYGFGESPKQEKKGIFKNIFKKKQ